MMAGGSGSKHPPHEASRRFRSDQEHPDNARNYAQFQRLAVVTINIAVVQPEVENGSRAEWHLFGIVNTE
jgi:hypothetical protein